MRAPIGHNAVGAVWRVAFPAITNDRMIRYADRRTVDNRQPWVRRFQACDAVWETFGTSGQLHEVSAGKRVLHLCGNVKWKTDQANAKSTQTAAGHLAPAMRSTNEDNSFNPGICLKNCGADNQAISGLLAENAFRGLPQRFLPHRLSGRNHLHVSEHPAHTVTDHHIRPMIWIKFIGPGQFFRAVEEPNRRWGCRSGRQTPRIDNVYGFQDRLEVH